MAVTDFLSSIRDTSQVIEMSRGNSGVVNDIQAKKIMMHEFLLIVPVITDVALGIQYGQQGTELTGTAVAGGGPTYYAY
jgi:hypothetical protein